MAKRSTPSTRPERPAHSVQEKQSDIIRLQRRIDELVAFDPATVTSRNGDPKVAALEASIESTLVSVFGKGTAEYNRYQAATRLDNGTRVMMFESSWTAARGGGYRHHDEAAEAARYLTDGKATSIALLSQAIDCLKEEIEFSMPHMSEVAPVALDGPRRPSSDRPANRRAFIVHGHDEGARESVARFLEKIGFEPVILHERANQGRTVIEKVEAHGDVDFAVVLLTPDDEGAKKGEALEPRARQNVLLELGYFLARLGRDRVCTLMRGQVSIPSDFAGAVWERMDDSGGWRTALARELEASGHEIDWNTIMRGV